MGLNKDYDGLLDGLESPSKESVGLKLLDPDIVASPFRALQQFLVAKSPQVRRSVSCIAAWSVGRMHDLVPHLHQQPQAIAELQRN